MTTADRFTVLDGGPTTEQREERLTEGAAELADGGRPSLVGREHFLLTVAAGLMALGVTVILIGWAGAANSTLVEEQVPYLISGGLLGLALTTIGALTLFTHWLTVSIRDGRRQEAARRQDHEELMGALRSIASSLADQEDQRDGRARGTRAQRPVRRAPRSS